MDFLLRDGADRVSVREESLRAARAAWQFCASGYGPGGGHKLIDDELVTSPASALRELPRDAALGPYQDLATSVQSHHGDQATLAVMLAANIVEAILDGGHVRYAAEGLELAKRQVSVWLDAATQTATAEATLAAVGPWAAELLSGLERVEGDLDAVEVRSHAGETALWSDALPVPANGVRASKPNVQVLLVEGEPRKVEARTRLRSPSNAFGEAEAAHARQRRVRFEALGVGLVVARKTLPDLPGWVVTDCPAGLFRRLALATGATPALSIDAFADEDLGTADLRFDGEFWVAGPGPVATFLVPAQVDGAPMDQTERMLRAVHGIVKSPGTLSGGGRWQRELADHLRGASAAAPRKAPLILDEVARAFDAIADALVANTGKNPLDVRNLGEHGDPAVCVRAAVSAAMATAAGLVRLDEKLAKRPSAGRELRGGDGPVGSPKGMPGDIPPLM